MNLVIVSFIVFGVAFGAATFRHRHLFSEGPARPAEADGNSAMACLGWMAVCAMLWPILSLSGVYGLWARRRRLQPARARRHG